MYYYSVALEELKAAPEIIHLFTFANMGNFYADHCVLCYCQLSKIIWSLLGYGTMHDGS